MSKYYSPHGSSNTDYIYVCDNCEIDDGRKVLVWNIDRSNSFSLFLDCINVLSQQYPKNTELEVVTQATIVIRKTIPESLRNKIFDRDGNKCLLCGSKINLRLDHIIPFSKGGKTEESNLQTLCMVCNSKKGA